MTQVQRGIVGRQAIGRGPEVQGVAGFATLEAVEGVGLGVDTEALRGAHLRAMQWAGTALLAGVVGAWREAEQHQHLGDGDGGADGGEVDGGPRRIGLLFELLVAGLSGLLAKFASLGEFAVALGEDGDILAKECVVGRDIADGAIQANSVVMFDILGNDPSGVLQRQRNLDADALALEGFVPAFDLAIALGIISRSTYMGHAGDADEFFEILGDELRSVVGDDARRDAGGFFAGALDDGFDVDFLHFFADFVVNGEAAAAIQDRAQEVKRAGDVEVADIDVPVFVWFDRLHEAGAFFGDVGRLAGEESSFFEDAIDAGRAARDDVGIEHHEGHAAITFGGILASEVADARDFVVGEPMIARDPGVVFVDFAEACTPIFVLASAYANPGHETRDGEVGFVAPGADEIDDGVTRVMRDPLFG